MTIVFVFPIVDAGLKNCSHGFFEVFNARIVCIFNTKGDKGMTIVLIALVIVVALQASKIKKMKKEIKNLRKERSDFEKDANKFFGKWAH